MNVFAVFGIGTVIIFTIVVIIGLLAVTFTLSSILCSRIAVSILVGLVAGSQNALVADGFLNFVIWAAIAGGIIFALSIFPRSNSATSYLCTIFITTIVVPLVGGAAFGIYSALAKLDTDISITAGYEILIKAVALFFAIGAYRKQYEKGSTLKPSGWFLVNVDRVIASLVIGFSLVFLITPWNNNWYTSAKIQWIVFIAGTLVAFIADILLNKDKKIYAETNGCG